MFTQNRIWTRVTAQTTCLLCLMMTLMSVQPLWAEHRDTNWKKQALIIGGGTAAGATVGALAGGKKGAAVGALAGGLGGTAYTLADRERGHYRERSKRKSALIIGGSSAAGAAVGGVAAGGKGAAIGALAGGLGGFIYDHKTNNRN
ncbi:MAG: hypothetical protein L0338_03410 [Acidobacteria bacterium]|nr:hypothetical protein [Acidobacteriota bacterium]